MSIIHSFQGVNGGWDWEGVPVLSYGPERPGVTVQRFISRRDKSNNLELRYFELEPGTTSNHESHNYEHAVLILRGRGTVRLGEQIHPIKFGDVILFQRTKFTSSSPPPTSRSASCAPCSTRSYGSRFTASST